MSHGDPSVQHPYARLAGSVEWSVLDRALHELIQNRDLVETTAHEYIVGYLCEALTSVRSNNSVSVEPPPHSWEARKEMLAQARAAIRAANPEGRDLVQELIDERRLEAERE